jgi:uncharacterized protein YndB with AHSA1/START domain
MNPDDSAAQRMSSNDPGQLSPSSTTDRELVIERVFDAPRELVYRVWTDSRHVAQWWGPNGSTITTLQSMDVRPGGEWRFIMHAPNGVDYPNRIVFLEVVEPERLVYSHGSGDNADPGFQAIVTFADEGRQTRLTLRQVYATAEQREYVAREYHAVELGNQTLNRFADFLATRAA